MHGFARCARADRHLPNHSAVCVRGSRAPAVDLFVLAETLQRGRLPGNNRTLGARPRYLGTLSWTPCSSGGLGADGFPGAFYQTNLAKFGFFFFFFLNLRRLRPGRNLMGRSRHIHELIHRRSWKPHSPGLPQVGRAALHCFVKAAPAFVVLQMQPRITAKLGIVLRTFFFSFLLLAHL